ncbi:hypothetical protein FOZ63_023366 [Perkinsus olseni]|uniref:Uncharacterized protein n=1 Tax=Perkinsus olseni TaxID=32597 RepID=A0A7J6TTA8_PEROL|nr:hypothetical protein FOZ63_023366 [Perkinsus olseni]
MSSKDWSDEQDCFRKIGTDEELTMTDSDRHGLFDKHPYERFLETDWMLERWKLKGKDEDSDFGERIAQLANSTVEERWVGEILGATEVVLGRILRTSQMIREARLPKDREEWLAGGPRGIYVLATAKACGDALRDLETWFSLLMSLLEVYQRQLSTLSKKVTRLERTAKGLRGNSRKLLLESRRTGQKHKYCQATGLHAALKTQATGLQGSAAVAVRSETEVPPETALSTPPAAADARELLQDLARRPEGPFGGAAQRQLHAGGHSAVASLELWKDVEAAAEGTLGAFNVTGESAFTDDLERLLARAAAAGGVSHLGGDGCMQSPSSPGSQPSGKEEFGRVGVESNGEASEASILKSMHAAASLMAGSCIGRSPEGEQAGILSEPGLAYETGTCSPTVGEPTHELTDLAEVSADGVPVVPAYEHPSRCALSNGNEVVEGREEGDDRSSNREGSASGAVVDAVSDHLTDERGARQPSSILCCVDDALALESTDSALVDTVAGSPEVQRVEPTDVSIVDAQPSEDVMGMNASEGVTQGVVGMNPKGAAEGAVPGSSPGFGAGDQHSDEGFETGAALQALVEDCQPGYGSSASSVGRETPTEEHDEDVTSGRSSGEAGKTGDDEDRLTGADRWEGGHAQPTQSLQRPSTGTAATRRERASGIGFAEGGARLSSVARVRPVTASLPASDGAQGASAEEAVVTEECRMAVDRLAGFLPQFSAPCADDHCDYAPRLNWLSSAIINTEGRRHPSHTLASVVDLLHRVALVRAVAPRVPRDVVHAVSEIVRLLPGRGRQLLEERAAKASLSGELHGTPRSILRRRSTSALGTEVRARVGSEDLVRLIRLVDDYSLRKRLFDALWAYDRPRHPSSSEPVCRFCRRKVPRSALPTAADPSRSDLASTRPTSVASSAVGGGRRRLLACHTTLFD